jgi:hypothetical protein
MGGVGGCLFQGGDDQGLHMVVGDRTRHPWARFVVQTLEALEDEPASPFRHGRFAHPEATRHLAIGVTTGALEHDAAPKGKRLRALWPASPTLERVALVVGEHQFYFGPAPLCHRCLPSSSMKGRTRSGRENSYI